VPWALNTEYRFFLEFHSGSFRITVTDPGDVELVSWSVEDTTYTSGGFGFYNFSQAPVSYSSFTRRDTPPACTTVLPPGVGGGDAGGGDADADAATDAAADAG
jgi:hypothetical protein